MKEIPLNPAPLSIAIEKTITNSDLHHDTDHTPYEGMKVNCWPKIVLSRGKIIVQDGQLQGEKGYGQFLKSRMSCMFIETKKKRSSFFSCFYMEINLRTFISSRTIYFNTLLMPNRLCYR